MRPADFNCERQGASRLPGGGWQFVLWAPAHREIILKILKPREIRLPMQPERRGYHSVVVDRLEPDSSYLYELSDGRCLPDPASRFQPDGVHKPSQIVELGAFEWSDSAWKGRDLPSSIFYELH